ncbi:hypothetical protein [Novosphingobium soli]|uniref:Uncharacterized protein n=1 Tax=Novosphingobium soli TaxID=574956 RepID=A0ABV6D0Z5_9SPHN
MLSGLAGSLRAARLDRVARRLSPAVLARSEAMVRPDYPVRLQACVFAVLAVVMLATRTTAATHVLHLPETSLASFFVLGYFVRRLAGFATLFALAFAIDVAVVGAKGWMSFCLTPAYGMLFPAYAMMWVAGRIGAARLEESATDLMPALVLLTGATLSSQILSSGGFYFLSGRFPDASVAGFLPRLMTYFPYVLVATLGWTGVAAIAWGMVLGFHPSLRKRPVR